MGGGYSWLLEARSWTSPHARYLAGQLPHPRNHGLPSCTAMYACSHACEGQGLTSLFLTPADMADIDITMSLEPSPGSLAASTTSGTTAWLVRLESGLVQGTQLVQRVRGGRAAWEQVGAKGRGARELGWWAREGRRSSCCHGPPDVRCPTSCRSNGRTSLWRSPATSSCAWAAGGGARMARGLPAGVQGGRWGGARAVQGESACGAVAMWCYITS